MIRLEKRPQPSRTWTAVTPVIAVIATMIAGGLLFVALGKDPFVAIRTIFWDPLFNETVRSIFETPTPCEGWTFDPDCDRAVTRLPSWHLEHRSRRSVYHGRHIWGSGGTCVLSAGGLVDLSADGPCRCFWRMGLGNDTRHLANPLQYKRNPCISCFWFTLPKISWHRCRWDCCETRTGPDFRAAGTCSNTRPLRMKS